MPGAWARVWAMMGGVREVRPRVRRELLMIVRRVIGLDMDFSGFGVCMREGLWVDCVIIGCGGG